MFVLYKIKSNLKNNFLGFDKYLNTVTMHRA